MTTFAIETARLIEADQALQAWVCFDPAPHAAADGPLAGLRFGVKDVIDVQGLPTRCGSAASSTAPAGLAHTGDSGFNKGWSMLGWPCLHLPTAFNAQGLPLGVMLVARPGADVPLLHWAHALHPLIDQRPH